MCGIFGHIGYIEQSKVKHCTNTLTHRGPDSFGIYHKDEFTFGHRRLAILDLSESGQQPMPYLKERYWTVFNGEIYNFLEIKKKLETFGYKFYTQSDTEVVLAAYDKWQEKCLNKFNGMWALAIYDTKKKELFISRDRFGKKPLFYTKYNNSFAFASEMKALTPLLKNIKIDQNTLNSKDTSYESTENTLIKNIKRFPAGHYGVYKNNNLTINKYWDTLDNLIEVPDTYEKQCEMFSGLFRDSCKIRMRSDVPIGTALSGGLDSSAVISTVGDIAKTGGERLADNWQNAFVASYPGADIDETKYARIVTEYLGINFNSVVINPTEYIDQLPKFYYNFEEIFYACPIPFIATYKAMREKGIVVTLDGHGADELFGGYEFDQIKLLNSINNPIKQKKILDVMYSQQINSRQFNRLPKKSTLLIKSIIKNLYKKNNSGYEQKISDPFNKILYSSSHKTVLPTLLRNYDHYSMANGIEIRMPFMDHRIIAFALSLPWESKLRNGYNKSIVRDSVKHLLPKEIVYRKTKIGFNPPLIEWMQGPMKNYLLDTINSDNFKNSNLIDSIKLKNDINDVINNKNTNFKQAKDTWTYLSRYFWEQYFFNKINK
jgi:asparagine synthase (glutamine-hydrolysing)